MAYDATESGPSSLLDRYHSLTGLARALAAAGAQVTVVQRFSRDDTLERDGVVYRFVADAHPALLPTSAESAETAAVIRASRVDVVHVNGLMFPAMVAALRAELPSARIVVQDHSGITAPRLINRLRDGSWRGLKRADAYSFTASAHADQWRDRGLLNDRAAIFEIVEASTTLAPVPRQMARERSNLHGGPLVLWVGRLNETKDPLTVVRGLERAFDEMPDASACLVYSQGALESSVRKAVSASARLRDRLTFAGRVPFERMAIYYSAADFYVSGSHREGSGYALIEGMACGVIPVVTDIPSFRVIARDCGVRWTAGDADSLRDALLTAARLDREAERARVHQQFMLELSWDAIAAKTLSHYRTLLA
jgi:glycosyltransferase involved in cell wall biosynthesis